MNDQKCQGDVNRPTRAGMIDEDAVRRGRVQASKMGKRRAWVLVIIHLAIFAHILHWQLAGETISPLEPSEAMYSVASGAVNAGAILLGLTLLSTLLLGRFFCGWACHLVALQDLCAWLMARVGIRPRPLRSRTMMLVPLGAGLALFGMPIVARAMAESPPPYETSLALTETEFWETFPGPILTVLTFLVCGFVCVYVLGAKGFCTYACPYGGLFGVLDKAAPGRIRVTDACRGCGHCTATCTSNVAVAEEVARFKMVVDQNCMKCLDCISVCPEDALYFGFGRPAVGASGKGRAKSRWTFSRAEEVALVLVFGVAMTILTGLPEAFAPWSLRLYGAVPMLFGTALAGLTAFLSVLAFRVLRGREVVLQKARLHDGRRITGPGFAFLAVTAVWFVFLGHSALVQESTWAGERAYLELDIAAIDWRTPENPDLGEPSESRLRTAKEAFEAARDMGLVADARLSARLGELAVVDGDLEAAERAFREAVRIEPGLAGSHANLGRTLWRTGDLDGAVSAFRAAVEHAPENVGFLRELGQLLVSGGRLEEAEPVLGQLVERVEPALRPDFRVDHAIALLRLGRLEDGERVLRKALEERPDHPRARAVLADVEARKN